MDNVIDFVMDLQYVVYCTDPSYDEQRGPFGIFDKYLFKAETNEDYFVYEEKRFELFYEYNGELHLINSFFENESITVQVISTKQMYNVTYNLYEYAKSITGIDGAAMIEVTKYDIDEEIGSVTVTEEARIKHIVDNLNSLTLLKLEYNEPTAIEYTLTFYNAGRETIKTISIELGGWIDYHGSLHSVTGGELDRAYIAELFTVLDGDENQNDIFYTAAYPEKFKYNDRRYSQVGGDGLKTTAAKEELGELLGYIIREEDVSKFTEESPNVDYVIDNGIYDYEASNRVALYCLKSYPDLSIICMHQLGEYVLYQAEQGLQAD